MEVARERLKTVMAWVIPDDETPGAGTDFLADRLGELVAALEAEVSRAYERWIPILQERDLDDQSHPFVPILIRHVRDLYYAYPETGSWAAIGFGDPV